MVETWLLAERTFFIPWEPNSRSYKFAERIIQETVEGKVPREKSSQREHYLSLAREQGLSTHTLNNILYVLRTAKVIPESPSGGKKISLQEDQSLQRREDSAPFSPPEGDLGGNGGKIQESKVPPEGSEKVAKEPSARTKEKFPHWREAKEFLEGKRKRKKDRKDQSFLPRTCRRSRLSLRVSPRL